MKKVFLFFLHTALLTFATLFASSFFEGASYAYHYVKAEEDSSVQMRTIAPKPSFAPFGSLLDGTNVLLLGIAGNPYPAPNLTDTVIVGSFKGDPLELVLTSLPRDLLVSVPGTKRLAKINSLYELGKTFSPLEPERFIKEKVEEISGLPISYVAIIDVRGLEILIDGIGGVDVDVKQEIFDPFFPGPYYSYDPFYLQKGSHHLDGKDAVRFARSRHSPRGDFDRVTRQQELLAAIRERVREREHLVSTFIDLVAQLKSRLVTNVALKDVPFFLGVLLNVNLQIVHRVVENGPSGFLNEFHTQEGAYALIPKAGIDEYGEIQTFFANEKE